MSDAPAGRETDNRERIARWALMAATVFLATGGLFGKVDDRGILTDAPAAAWGTILLLLFLFMARAFPFSRESLSLLLLLALAALWKPRNPSEALNGAGAFIAFSAGLTGRGRFEFRRVAMACGVLLIGIALYQRFIIFPSLILKLEGEARERLASGRIFSTFILPAQFSAYLAVILPFALAHSLMDRPKLLYRGAVILILVALAMTRSISGILAAGCGALFLLGFSRRTFLFVVVLAMVVTAAVIPRSREFRWDPEVNPLLLRVNTWHATILAALDSPLLGRGAGSFEEDFVARYRTPLADEVAHPHSWPLKILFENGLVGLAAWLLLAGGLFRRIGDRSFRAAAIAFFLASLLDIADASFTLRALGLFSLGASLERG